MFKKSLLAAAAALVLPVAANAQSGTTYPGFYIGAEGGLNWLLNNNSYQMDTGWAAGGKVGYDFVGPARRVGGHVPFQHRQRHRRLPGRHRQRATARSTRSR